MVSIQKKWYDLSKSLPPVGYVLRNNLNEFWIRVHSLPDSKRYAENNQEIKELLYRHMVLFKDCFASNDCYIIMGFYSDQLKKKDSILWIKELMLEDFGTFNIAEGNDEDCCLSFSYSLFRKDTHLFKSIIKDIANENVGPVIFFSPSDEVIYAPYDGGIDLFFLGNSKSKIEGYKNKYSQWRSSRNDGL